MPIEHQKIKRTAYRKYTTVKSATEYKSGLVGGFKRGARLSVHHSVANLYFQQKPIPKIGAANARLMNKHSR